MIFCALFFSTNVSGNGLFDNSLTSALILARGKFSNFASWFSSLLLFLHWSLYFAACVFSTSSDTHHSEYSRRRAKFWGLEEEVKALKKPLAYSSRRYVKDFCSFPLFFLHSFSSLLCFLSCSYSLWIPSPLLSFLQKGLIFVHVPFRFVNIICRLHFCMYSHLLQKLLICLFTRFSLHLLGFFDLLYCDFIFPDTLTFYYLQQ